MRAEINPRFDYAILLVLAFSAFCALFIILWSTPLGVGVSTDSTIYLDTARSIIAGGGFFADGEPMTHYPPIYPTLLALAGFLDNDLLNGARWLHALLFALNVLLVGIITYLSTNKSATASLCSIFLFLSSAKILELHTMAWSEPPFILFSLSTLLLLAFHIYRPRIWLLFSSSFFLGLALMTRYVGLALLPPVMIVILLFEKRKIKDRIRDSLVMLTIGISPLIIWLVRNILTGQSATGRALAFHPINATHMKSLIGTMCTFYLPISWQDRYMIPQMFFVLLVSGSALAGFLLVLRSELLGERKVSVNRIMQTLTILFSITYVSLLFASITFADADTAFDYRIMSPVYTLGVIFFVSVSWSFCNLRKSPGLWRWVLLFASVLIIVNSWPAFSYAIHLRNEGRDYTSRTWRNSESIAYVRSLPKSLIIYSNGPDVISFLTKKRSFWIPQRVSSNSLSSDPDFATKMKAMRNDLAQNEALVVYLDNIDWRWYLPTKEDLETVYKLPVFLRLQDGTIYAIKN